VIIGAIFFAFVAACALVLFFVIVKSVVEDARAGVTAPPARTILVTEDREARFLRDTASARRAVTH
jgi:hypothetical protein